MTLFLAYNHLDISGYVVYYRENDVFNNIIHAAADFFIVSWSIIFGENTGVRRIL